MKQLLQGIAKAVEKSIAPKVTEYVRKHPECFHDTSDKKGLIAIMSITVSYHPDNTEQIKGTKPNVSMFFGDTNYGFEYNIFESGTVYKYAWVKGKCTKEYK